MKINIDSITKAFAHHRHMSVVQSLLKIYYSMSLANEVAINSLNLDTMNRDGSVRNLSLFQFAQFTSQKTPFELLQQNGFVEWWKL